MTCPYLSYWTVSLACLIDREGRFTYRTSHSSPFAGRMAISPSIITGSHVLKHQHGMSGMESSDGEEYTYQDESGEEDVGGVESQEEEEE